MLNTLRIPGSAPVLLLALGACTHSAPDVSPVPCRGDVDACGLEPSIIPDFELVDLNVSSASYEQTFVRDDFLGKVLVVYWATAT